MRLESKKHLEDIRQAGELILIHAHDVVDDRVVWEAATKKLPDLLGQVRTMLDEPTETEWPIQEARKREE